jgi:hypothetical protein
MKASIPALAVAFLATTVPASAEVQLTLRDGRVSIKATNATVREILAEWAKVGQSRIVNADRIVGAPLTLELSNVTEGQALDVLLRSVASYMAAPRPTAIANASQFDRILILPTSTPPRTTAAAPTPPPFPQPQFNPPPDDQDDQRPQPATGPRGPVFNTFPQPGQPGFPPQPVGPPGAFPPPGQAPPPAPASSPFGNRGNAPGPGGQAPIGAPMPGMVVQPPPQTPPGQIQQ